MLFWREIDSRRKPPAYERVAKVVRSIFLLRPGDPLPRFHTAKTQSRHPGGNILGFSTTRLSAETDEPRLRRAQSRGHHAHVQAEGRALQRDQQMIECSRE